MIEIPKFMVNSEQDFFKPDFFRHDISWWERFALLFVKTLSLTDSAGKRIIYYKEWRFRYYILRVKQIEN